MSFKEWLFSSYPNPSVNNRWGTLHIAVLALCVIAIVAIAFLKNRSKRTKYLVICALVFCILCFEITRRAVNLCKGDEFWYTVLPRPWCAISCWLCIFSVLVKKDFFYNLASMSSIICIIIFFAYPSAGFNNQYMLFENVYSIATHALLFVTSVSFITLGFTDFKYKRSRIMNSALRELIGIICIFAYGFLQIFVLKIQTNADPLYFMPDNEVQAFLGVNYPIFLIIYIGFLAFYFNLFYFIQYAVDKKRNK